MGCALRRLGEAGHVYLIEGTAAKTEQRICDLLMWSLSEYWMSLEQL